MKASTLFRKAARLIRRVASSCAQLLRLTPQYWTLRTASNPRFSLRWRDLWLCLGDATPNTGFDRHYILHTAWASRILAGSRPAVHTDISSSLSFVTNVSAFVPVRFFDFRPAKLGLTGLTIGAADLYSLPFADRSVESLSCMHVVEHVGLGRYGDPVDYNGDLRAAGELQRVLAPGGQLLFVVPVGSAARIQFNAHRIYRPGQVIEMFDELSLKQFALIPELEHDGDLVISPDDTLVAKQRYACGCFLFVRHNAAS